jgi:hypothetical protein
VCAIDSIDSVAVLQVVLMSLRLRLQIKHEMHLSNVLPFNFDVPSISRFLDCIFAFLGAQTRNAQVDIVPHTSCGMQLVIMHRMVGPLPAKEISMICKIYLNNRNYIKLIEILQFSYMYACLWLGWCATVGAT